MRRLTAGDITGIHAFLAEEFGGEGKPRDAAALARLTRDLAAEGGDDLHEAAARLMAGIVQSAPFTEGNARTAFFAADVFLRMNGVYLRCDNVLALRFFSALLEEGAFTAEILLPWIRANAERLSP